MKIFILLLTFFNFSFAFDMVVIPATDNEAFNYFFSFPLWVTIISIPMILAISVFRHLR